MTRRDYYEILGVEREADDGVIKTAYRKLAMQYHPDRNPGSHESEERFKEAAEAYSVLMDPQKRAAYNRFGHQGVPTAAGNGGFDAQGFPDLGDILSDMFGLGDVFGRSGGGGQKRTRARRGGTGVHWAQVWDARLYIGCLGGSGQGRSAGRVQCAGGVSFR